MIENNTIVMIL